MLANLRDVAELARRFGSELVTEAAAQQWIQPPEQLCRDFRLVSGEIEVTAQCNWRCRSCPVAVDPKPIQMMPMPLFTEILDKLVAHGLIDYMTFQFFNQGLHRTHSRDAQTQVRELFGDICDKLARWATRYLAASPITANILAAMVAHELVGADAVGRDQARLRSQVCRLLSVLIDEQASRQRLPEPHAEDDSDAVELTAVRARIEDLRAGCPDFTTEMTAWTKIYSDATVLGDYPQLQPEWRTALDTTADLLDDHVAAESSPSVKPVAVLIGHRRAAMG